MLTAVQDDSGDRNSIDTETTTLIQVTKAFGTQENPFSNLPNELLSRIFIACKAAADTGGRNRDALPAVLTLTSVCSRWSHIARETPDLWSTILLSRPTSRWVAEAFDRSKQAPLTILGPLGNLFHNKCPAYILPTILSSSSRFEEVDITVTSTNGSSRGSIDLLQKFANQPAPLLRNLKLIYEGYEPERHGGLVLEYHRTFGPMVHSFPWSDSRSLQSMTLRNIIPIAVPMMPCLKNLVVEARNMNRRFGFRPLFSVQRVVDILNSTPALETASLAVISTDSDSNTAPNVLLSTASKSPPLSLPNLRKFDVVAASIKESILFTRLDLPGLRETSISYTNDRSDPALHANANLLNLRHHVSRCIPSDVGQLKVTVKSLAHRRQACEFVLKVVEDSGGELPIFELAIQNFPQTDEHIKIVESLPLGKVTSLILVGVSEPAEVIAWSDAIPHFVHLKHICVEKVPVLRWLGASPSQDSISLNDVFNPNLETVVLEDNAMDSPNDWAMLEFICQFRYTEGRPVKKVSMGRGNDLGTGSLARFSRFVTVLDMRERQPADVDED